MAKLVAIDGLKAEENFPEIHAEGCADLAKPVAQFNYYGPRPILLEGQTLAEIATIYWAQDLAYFEEIGRNADEALAIVSKNFRIMGCAKMALRS